MRTIHKINKMSFGHVECTFGNAAENFGQRSGQLSLKFQKLSKFSENTIIVLKVVHWTRKKQFWQLCWKLSEGKSRNFASKSKLNWKTNVKKNFLKKFSNVQNAVLTKLTKLFLGSLGNVAETFRQRSGRLSLYVRKQFWKNLKKR